MRDKQDELSHDLRSEWEDVLGHKLTSTEFEELKENLLAFFTLLHDWQREDEESSQDRNGSNCEPGSGGERE